MVTSDRRLALDCKSAGARITRSGDFRKRMAASGARSTTDPGEAEVVQDAAIDDWMRYFGVDPDDEGRS